MSDIEITLTGADEMIARFRQAPTIVKEEMLRGVDNLTLQGQVTSMKESPVDTGKLRQSITQQKATFAGGAATGAWGTNVPYAKYAEDGRGAGKMPPAGALSGWIRRHGGGSEFVIRRAIGRKGTKGKHFMQKGRLFVQPKVKPTFDVVAQRIVKRLEGG